ncbi:thioredoxin family protein [Engelhardtia mirabilis]|uniref:Thioredoxin-like fold domain-containing protein n=1 Tax=Engelhardtia mirabilis TaxID=2528011 RepID=A0A518BE16_9BACT|nr:hypothetical protein Pla133_02760 [Planctomycetes bacterium Pla133]QDU99538.1 hypothetical protein Pla86_02760 [Planctomycetes bacterium Pla86]
MTVIKVLGPGCKNCVQTAKLINQAAQELGLEVEVQKETDIATIMAFGALSTPGVVIDDKLVHAGGVPTLAQIRGWLQ